MTAEKPSHQSQRGPSGLEAIDLAHEVADLMPMRKAVL